MGKMDRLLEFGNSRRGKLVGWGLSLVFALIFFVGIGMTASGAASPNIQNIEVIAQNVHQGTVVDADGGGNFFGWHLTVTDLKTPLRINTIPFVQTAQVRLSTGSHLITIRDETIMSGGSTYIELNPVGGMFEFHSPEPDRDVDRIVIAVECGNMPTRFIFVRIVLTEHATQFTARLERNPGSPDAWVPASVIRHEEFVNTQTPLGNDIRYRARIQFKIFGQVVFDSIRRERIGEEYRYEYNRFSITELGLPTVPIGLFAECINPEVGSTGLILVQGAGRTTEEQTFVINFRIAVNFNDQEFVMNPNFRVNIVVPPQ